MRTKLCDDSSEVPRAKGLPVSRATDGPAKSGNQETLARLKVGRAPASGPVTDGGRLRAYTRNGKTYIDGRQDNHPQLPRIMAHEQAHHLQSQSGAPQGTQRQLERDASRGDQSLLEGKTYSPAVSSPTNLTLGYDPEQYFPNLQKQNTAEQRSLEQQGLTDPDSSREFKLQRDEDHQSEHAHMRNESLVSASGDDGQIQSNTIVVLDYDPQRTVTVVGPAQVQISPEMGLGPADQRPTYPYVLIYSRTISGLQTSYEGER